MQVSEVMTSKVFTVSSSSAFPEIVKLLVRKRVSGLPVVNKKGRVIGVISEKDLFYRLFPSQKKFYKNLEYYMNFERIEKEAKKISKLKAKHFMSKNIVSVRSDDNVLKACSLFLIHNIRRLPVINDGKLIGIVTTNNIYKNFLGSLVKSSK